MHHYSSHYQVKPHHHPTLKHLPSQCLNPFYQVLERCCVKAKQRYLVATLTSIGITILYMQRMCLSIMITDMVKNKPTKKTGDSCPPYTGDFMSERKTSSAEFDWSVQLQGELIASFFYGYFITHVPGGIISDLFGGKHIFGVTVLLSSVCMAVSPVCARANPYILLAIRTLMGLIQGPLFPAITTIVAHWSPPDERGLMNTITNSGVPLGLVLGNLVTGQILYLTNGWDLPFYLYAGMGGFWYIFWLLFVSPTPESHPFITDEECDYIVNSIHASSKEPAGKIPWCEILTCKEVIVATVANLGHESVLFLISSELPIYQFSVLRLPTGMNGFLSSIPWMFMWCGNFLFGNLSKLLVRRNIMKTLTLRRVFGGLANLIPSVCFVIVVHCGCNYLAVTSLVSTGTFFIGATFSSIRASFLDIGPNFAGITMSIAASVAGVAGFIVPLLVHALIGDGTREKDWRISFYIINGFVALSTIPFLIFIRSDVLPWNEGHKKIRTKEEGKE